MKFRPYLVIAKQPLILIPRIRLRQPSWFGYFILSVVCALLVFGIPVFDWSIGLIPFLLGATIFFQFLSADEFFNRRRKLRERNIKNEDIY
jgi:hypothetical protein